MCWPIGREKQVTRPRPAPPAPTPYEMSKARAPAHEVAIQVKLWGWSCQDGGSGPLAARQHLELRAFLRLLEHSCLQEFLARDPCFQVSDKYLLAMVLVYFRRANLKLSEYTCSNLFLAL